MYRAWWVGRFQLVLLLLGKAYRFSLENSFPTNYSQTVFRGNPEERLICFSEIKKLSLAAKFFGWRTTRSNRAVARKHARSLRPVSLFGIHGGRPPPPRLNLRREEEGPGTESRAEQAKPSQRSLSREAPEDQTRPRS